MVPPVLRPIGSTIAIIATFFLVGATAGCAPRAAPIRLAEPPPPHEHVVTGPLGARTGAYLTVRDAASRVQVELASMPGLLYRISTPADSGLAPRVSGRGGRFQAALLRTVNDGPDEVTIVLNRDVRWALALPAGAGEQRLDLRRGRISRVELGPSGLVEMRLPPAAGTVPVTLASGVGSVVLAAGPATPMRIQLDEGAGAADIPWATGGPAPAGAVLQTPGWPASWDRYAIRAHAGVGALTVR
jgi:hypothetical protein